MDCVNCGHDNPDKALICYWCGLNPSTGESPYQALTTSAADLGEFTVPEVTLPPPVQIPSTLAVPTATFGTTPTDSFDLAMPDLPTIEVSPPPGIPDQSHFAIVRRRARHRPVVRASHTPRVQTHPVLTGWGRLLVLAGGLGLLLALGSALLGAIGAASLGSAFCLVGLLGLTVLLVGGLLLARAGKHVVRWADVTYERLEVLGRVLREVAPGIVQELPVNLAKSMGVLDLPVAYSELRSLSGRGDEPPMDLAVDLLTGAIANLVGRDDVLLAHRTYPVQARGMTTQTISTQVSRPVLTRRHAYVGPGALEERIARILQTNQPMTIDKLLGALVGHAGRQRAQQVIAWVEQALDEKPPDLEALSSPEQAMAELEQFREAMRQADPELYKLLQDEIRRGLGVAVQRSIPSSLLDLARSASTAIDHPSKSGS